MNIKDVTEELVVIISYEIKDDIILIHFNGGKEYSIPYTIQNEENLILVMKLQNEEHNIKSINVEFLKYVLFLGMSVMCCTGGIFAFPRCDMVWKVISFLVYLGGARNIKEFSLELFQIFQWLDCIQKNYDFLEQNGYISEIDDEDMVFESGMCLSSDIMEEYCYMKGIIEDVSNNYVSENDKGKILIKK